MGDVYAPGEDSYLLRRHVERLARGRVLDMGTGSGIQAITSALKQDVELVVAADVNPAAIEVARKRASEAGVIHKVSFVVTDLFEEMEQRFDWIVFNPPYLPSEGGIKDQTWDGGASGRETIERFLDEAKSHLAKGGSILLIYSSESGLKPKGHGYRWEILEEKALFFETLCCARLTLS